MNPITVEPKEGLFSSRFLFSLFLIFCGFCFLLYVGFFDDVLEPVTVYLLFSVCCSVLALYFFVRSLFSPKPKIVKRAMYKFEIMLPNGRKEVFESSNETTIIKITDAIDQAINKKGGVSLQMSDVNVQISNSENVSLGSVSSG